jgi:hypothetical protein
MAPKDIPIIVGLYRLNISTRFLGFLVRRYSENIVDRTKTNKAGGNEYSGSGKKDYSQKSVY